MTAASGTTVLTRELIALLDDRKDGRLRRLIASGVIRETRGRVQLGEAVPVFLTDLRADLAEGSAVRAAESAREARADAAALRLAERRREMVPVADLDAAFEHLCGVVSSSLSSLPARVTRDPRDRRRVEGIVFDLRTRIGDAVGRIE